MIGDGELRQILKNYALEMGLKDHVSILRVGKEHSNDLCRSGHSCTDVTE
jgi:hypothetical protein